LSQTFELGQALAGTALRKSGGAPEVAALRSATSILDVERTFDTSGAAAPFSSYLRTESNLSVAWKYIANENGTKEDHNLILHQSNPVLRNNAHILRQSSFQIYTE